MTSAGREEIEICRFPGLRGVEIRRGRWICAFQEGLGRFEFFLHIKPGAKRLLVLGQGATKRLEHDLPRFQRLDWADRFEDSVIIINDPTLYLHERLHVGWCAGTPEQHFLLDIRDFILHVAAQLTIPPQRILLYGSSAGGFAALMLATHIQGATAVVNNPQTDVLRFRAMEVNLLLRSCFAGISVAEAYERYPDRFCFLDRLDQIERVPTIYYLQNVRDTHHFEHHLRPFLDKLYMLSDRWQASDGDANIQLDLYRHDESEHLPLGLRRAEAAIRIARGMASQPPAAPVPPRSSTAATGAVAAAGVTARRARWARGRAAELGYWREVIAGNGDKADAQARLRQRARADAPFAAWLIGYITTATLAEARILDLGSGPVSVLGWQHAGRPLDILAVDPLADLYGELLAAHNIAPPIRPVDGEGESLLELARAGSLDLIHARNALDQCYDPARVIRNCIYLLKPGGSCIIQGAINEGQRCRYQGLHLWNLELRAGRLMLWCPEAELDIGRLLPDAQVEILTHTPERAWLSVRLQKARA